MKIQFPNHNGEPYFIEDKQSIVLIGANGAGKTRLSVWVEKNNPALPIHRISAQKSLNMPKTVSPTDIDSSKEQFWYGVTGQDANWMKHTGKINSRWGRAPETHLLNDFEQMMVYLMTESYQKSIEYRENHKQGHTDFDNETKLETIKRIWESILPHRELIIDAGKIEVRNRAAKEAAEATGAETAGKTAVKPPGEGPEKTPSSYNGAEMSDGERAVFYFIGEVLSAPENSLVIIDEPENHLHKSILNRLWTAIEAERRDCTFLYITHSLEFANSRLDAALIWVKQYDGGENWDFEELDGTEEHDALELEILGNRQKVLLVEGTRDKSFDVKLYSTLFPDYNVLPQESCNQVIQYTRAYAQLRELHYIEVSGIVDRDRRSREQIASLREKGIYVPEVAEVENFFLLPGVIQAMCTAHTPEKTYEEILKQAQDKTFEILSRERENQALLYAKDQCENEVLNALGKTATTLEAYQERLSQLSQTTHIQEYYDQRMQELDEILESRDYLGALKVINQKGLLNDTGVPACFGWRASYFQSAVLRYLQEKGAGSDLAEYLRGFIPMHA